MKRRVVLKQLAFLTTGSLFLPSVIIQGCSAPLKSSEDTSEIELLLACVAETIIPETDTLGAKELNVHLFVMKMIDDCYDVHVQERFMKGLAQLNELCKRRYGERFENSSSTERLALLADIQNGEGDKDAEYFLSLMKKLTIQGYLDSEYVMTNLIKYELVPARYNGYFPVKGS